VAYQVTSTAEAPTPPNEAMFTSVTVSYTAGFVPGEDLLIFIQSDISHSPVAYPGVNATASLENIVSDTGSMTFTGLAPAAVWEAILGRISYANAWVYVNYTLTAGVRNFSVCATDTAGNTGCSDAPALALYPGPPPYGIGAASDSGEGSGSSGSGNGDSSSSGGGSNSTGASSSSSGSSGGNSSSGSDSGGTGSSINDGSSTGNATMAVPGGNDTATSGVRSGASWVPVGLAAVAGSIIVVAHA
jgi:hypothetical protein